MAGARPRAAPHTRCAQPVAETDDCHENPLEVPRHLIRMFSFAADAVVDPFAGAGTTAPVAIETRRNRISVEIEPRYVDVVEQRLAGANALAAKIASRRNGVKAAARRA